MRDGARRAFVRVIGRHQDYHWQVGAAGDSVDEWIAKQRGYDPDLWVIELDTPDLARFIDETIV